MSMIGSESSTHRIHKSGPEPFEACPDGGRCWHDCPLVESAPEGKGLPCWRVANAAPFTGTYPDEPDGYWPDQVRVEHASD